MALEPDSDSVLVTARQRAVYRVLADAGFSEGSGVGYEATETSPVALAFILDGVLSSNPSEDQLLDAMTWGQHRELWNELRPVARRLLELTKVGSSPA
jgi:hypothetical protein